MLEERSGLYLFLNASLCISPSSASKCASCLRMPRCTVSVAFSIILWWGRIMRSKINQTQQFITPQITQWISLLKTESQDSTEACSLETMMPQKHTSRYTPPPPSHTCNTLVFMCNVSRVIGEVNERVRKGTHIISGKILYIFNSTKPPDKPAH